MLSQTPRCQIHSFSKAIPHKLAMRIQPEIFRRKKAVFRRHTLCMARKNNAFPAEKIGCSPATHLCGVALNPTFNLPFHIQNKEPCRLSHQTIGTVLLWMLLALWIFSVALRPLLRVKHPSGGNHRPQIRGIALLLKLHDMPFLQIVVG